MVMKKVCIGSIYKTCFFFLNSSVFIKLSTKIRGMQAYGYGLKNSKFIPSFLSTFCLLAFFLQKMPRFELRPSLIVARRPMPCLVMKSSRRGMFSSL